ncbi:MAG: sensor histidine kinase [Candidatus Thorarchaeota archaeon]
MLKDRITVSNLIRITVLITICLGLYAASLYNYLLFHGLVELSSIGIAVAVFTIGWNSKLSENKFYYILGIGYLFIGVIDLFHTLAYSGMNVFIGFDANLPTQLWIFARFLEAFTMLFLSSIVHKRKINRHYVLPIYFLILIVILPMMFIWPIFPTCFIEGMGLTLFKVLSEYVIVGILILSLYFFRRNKDHFNTDVFKLLNIAILLTIAEELAFTLYTDVYGLTNLIGHFFKLFSFFVIYLAIVRASIQRPQETLFRKFKMQEQSLIDINDTLRLTGSILRHDVGNQLMIIGAVLELLEESPEELEVAKRATSRSIEIIKDLGAMSLLVDDGEPLTPYSMREAVVVAKTKSSININIEGDCKVLADRTLSSIIANIIGNAELHSGSTKIDVTIQKKEGFCITQIIDYGIGVHESIREILFEKKVKYGETSGTGMGLFIAKSILLRYGGDITYEPNTPSGSIFTIYVKCA